MVQEKNDDTAIEIKDEINFHLIQKKVQTSTVTS